MKVGILGGTFDPIHNAHLQIACEARKQFALDKVLIMPTPNPPHKDKNHITSNFHRANMVRLAVADKDGVEFSDFELGKHDVTYTADTLYMLKELHPDDEYYFILGSDSIVSFSSWYRPDVIVKYATILAVRRDDESAAKMDEEIATIERTFDVHVGVINMPSMAVSSSYIRTHSYEEIRGMVPEPVYHYIMENQLYQNQDVNVAWSINKITEDLKSRLSEKRFTHTLGVAKTAKQMAEFFQVNPNKAYFAGMLHDCAKNLTETQLLEICRKENLPISESEQSSPHLLHAKVGAFLARTRYGITDEEILSAITWHTTGKPEMTDLEKIVFCADYIEPGRDKQPHLEELRALAQKDLDLLTYRILEDTMDYLKQSGRTVIDENTAQAYQYYNTLITKT